MQGQGVNHNNPHWMQGCKQGSRIADWSERHRGQRTMPWLPKKLPLACSPNTCSPGAASGKYLLLLLMLKGFIRSTAHASSSVLFCGAHAIFSAAAALHLSSVPQSFPPLELSSVAERQLDTGGMHLRPAQRQYPGTIGSTRLNTAAPELLFILTVTDTPHD